MPHCFSACNSWGWITKNRFAAASWMLAKSVRPLNRRAITMSEFASLQIFERYAHYRPQQHVSWSEGTELLDKAVAFCREQGVHALLIDTRGLSGFKSPDTVDRYFFARQLAWGSAGEIKIALIAAPELIDPERFGVAVARIRGLAVEVFTSEAEALGWLLS